MVKKMGSFDKGVPVTLNNTSVSSHCGKSVDSLRVVKCGEQYMFLGLTTWVEEDGYDGAVAQFTPDTEVDSIPWREYVTNEMMYASLVEEIVAISANRIISTGPFFVNALTPDGRVLVARGMPDLEAPKTYREQSSAEFYRVQLTDIVEAIKAQKISGVEFIPYGEVNGVMLWYDTENKVMYDQWASALNKRQLCKIFGDDFEL